MNQLRAVALDDKYSVAAGTVLMTGTQALVRLPLMQRAADKGAGHDTAGFISGYRGSPLGGYDMEIMRARAHLDAADIMFQPGLNEELAATAVWGTQMLQHVPRAKRDGVFGIWYGKGPGVDRAGDALKHGNMAGTHPLGGVLVCAGDDHAGKSSTVAHQSELALMNAGIPIFAPADAEDILNLGRLGFALSRYAGVYVALKLTNEVLEQTMTVDIEKELVANLPPTGELPPEGIHNRPTHVDRLRSEVVFKRYRLPLVARFLAANPVDRTLFKAPEPKLGIITAGKVVGDVRQALSLLGLDDAAAAALGISLLKVGCVHPLQPEALRSFALGHSELLFAEEKEGLVEQQAKSILYGAAGAPSIVGKYDDKGHDLLPKDVQLDPAAIALVILDRLSRLRPIPRDLAQRGERVASQAETALGLSVPDVMRSPAFCSGCPHNRGTRVPEGSVAAGGIGCHAMAMLRQPEMLPSAQMGGEGAHWYSLARYTDVPHIFQNLGDGTYYHSGLLAIRGAIAAGVNITYKILYNDAVAMTGGQPHDGPLSVIAVARQVVAEGVAQCVVVSDMPERYKQGSIAPGVDVRHRDELDEVQRRLRVVPGVTVIIYEQECAAEKRRRRKRGKLIDPPRRLFINDMVCEGCGDCSAKSGCVSLWSKETELGRKRQIDQSSCNKDFSCKDGFCPSFVTVLGGRPRKQQSVASDALSKAAIADAPVAPVANSYNIMIAGIGGTGVVTIGALLAMAGHLEGKACSVMDMTGLSQKNGAVFSHVRIAQDKAALGSPRLGAAEADLVLAFDMIAARAKESAAAFDRGRTQMLMNEAIVPTAAFQSDPDASIDADALRRQFEALIGEGRVRLLDATAIGTALLGDSIASNLILLGFAAQHGLLPVSAQSVIEAIRLNGVAVSFNEQAFRIGRLMACNPDLVRGTMGGQASPVIAFDNLTDIVDHRRRLLNDYQGTEYAERYVRLVSLIESAEERALPGSTKLAVAVARNLAKLMAYKDEYEVGRLYSQPAFRAQLAAAFEGSPRILYHLAPPFLARTDPATGRPRKMTFGPWMGIIFRILAACKFMRGTPLDPFGYTAERRMERELINRYEAHIQEIVARLSADNHATAIAIARLPEQIRGFGHVKQANAARVAANEARLLSRFRAPDAERSDGKEVRQGAA